MNQIKVKNLHKLQIPKITSANGVMEIHIFLSLDYELLSLGPGF